MGCSSSSRFPATFPDDFKRNHLIQRNVLVTEEAIPGHVEFFRFRTPTSYKGRAWHYGKSFAVAVTTEGLHIFVKSLLLGGATHAKLLISAPWSDPRIQNVVCYPRQAKNKKNSTTLAIRFDASWFHQDMSGRFELCMKAERAQQFQNHIQDQIRRHSREARSLENPNMGVFDAAGLFYLAKRPGHGYR
ncbi:expressed unknown protein [Seminavis robusta]|uniref:Uncharacterized protein n=1 Tax=Seminavis robusta TaxID=568900 RepID=A0A9N8DRA3_9STRA|nr:expressed unknown protein [Seminavis robusta]|eukprot:Sro226_g092080.1 n/a (189) ;mRNA; r:67780-68346